MPFSSREEPTNLVDLLQSRQALDPSTMRAHYPEWIDDDIRRNLDQVLQAEPDTREARKAASASEEYQRMLSSLAQEVRAKQYAIQHRSIAAARSSRDDSQVSTPRPYPPPSPASPISVVASLSQSVGASASSRRPHHQPQSIAPTTGGPRSRSPRKSILRSLSAKSVRGGSTSSSSSSSSRAAPSTKLIVTPPTPPVPPPPAELHHLSSASILRSPRGTLITSPRSGSHSSSAHIGAMPPLPPPAPPAGTINVPLSWFNDMEAKLSHLASLGGSAGEQADKAAELQRLKYAMLVSKLDEMNRLHREVLSEEHQKQHLHDLEALQRQHMREFHTRLEAAQAENRRLLQERESERAAQRSARDNERVVLDQWSKEKDESIESLRTHFLEREKLLMEAHRTAEAAWQEQRQAFHASALQAMDEREKERRAMEAVRKDLSLQGETARDQVRRLQEQVNARTFALDTTKRELEETHAEKARLQAKVDEARQRMELVDAMQTKLHRLQLERADLLTSGEAKERYWREREEELATREKRLERVSRELDEREAARREARRRERREGVAGGDGSGGQLGVYSSLHRAAEGEYDCAWASGPIDRKQLAVPVPAGATTQYFR